MSQDRPSIDDLLGTVGEFLVRLAPGLEPESRFQVQVAAHLIGICQRELALGARFDAEERSRYGAFLGESGAAAADTLAELTRALCAGIRSGRFDERWQELIELVLGQVARKVEIVRPSQLEPMHRP
jgi:hypothetical protein